MDGREALMTRSTEAFLHFAASLPPLWPSAEGRPIGTFASLPLRRVLRRSDRPLHASRRDFLLI